MLIADKIKSRAELVVLINKLKSQGRKVVFTNGCFDILHYGHVKYLEDAAGEGDILVVAVNSDSSIKRIKGDRRPIIPEPDRLRLVAALESVDYVTKFDEDTPLELVKQIWPDVLVKGGDWEREKVIGGEIVEKWGGRVVIIPFQKGYSTTELIKRIRKVEG